MKILNQKGFSAVEVLLVVVVVALLGLVGWLVYDRQNNTTDTNQSQATTETVTEEQEPLPSLEAGTFGDEGEYGTAQVEGYASTEKRDEAFCEDDCEEFDYIFFNVTRTENENLFDYLEGMDGNAFVKDRAIGLGCVADGVISYANASNGKITEYEVAKSETSAILASTAEEPVILEIEKQPQTGGSGAPACYSHFTTFKVVE